MERSLWVLNALAASGTHNLRFAPVEGGTLQRERPARDPVMSKSKRATKLSARRRRVRYALRRVIWVAGVTAVVLGIVAADRLGLFGLAPTPDRERYHDKSFRVVRVIDGDTLVIDAHDSSRREKHTRIRLWGVDTPETVKPNSPVEHFGPEASAFAKRVATGITVRLELDPDRTRGVHGRLLAYVFLPDGRMLNSILIEQGFGYADPRFPHGLKKKFLRLQRRAKAERRGLWKDVRKKDLPSYYRDKLKLP